MGRRASIFLLAVCSRVKVFEGILGMREFEQPVEIAASFCGGQRQR